jgi:hypothetical protein
VSWSSREEEQRNTKDVDVPCTPPRLSASFLLDVPFTFVRSAMCAPTSSFLGKMLDGLEVIKIPRCLVVCSVAEMQLLVHILSRNIFLSTRENRLHYTTLAPHSSTINKQTTREAAMRSFLVTHRIEETDLKNTKIVFLSCVKLN